MRRSIKDKLRRSRLSYGSSSEYRSKRVLSGWPVRVLAILVLACAVTLSVPMVSDENVAYAEGWAKCAVGETMGVYDLQYALHDPRFAPVIRTDDGYFNINLLLTCYPHHMTYTVYNSEGKLHAAAQTINLWGTIQFDGRRAAAGAAQLSGTLLDNPLIGVASLLDGNVFEYYRPETRGRTGADRRAIAIKHEAGSHLGGIEMATDQNFKLIITVQVSHQENDVVTLPFEVPPFGSVSRCALWDAKCIGLGVATNVFDHTLESTSLAASVTACAAGDSTMNEPAEECNSRISEVGSPDGITWFPATSGIARITEVVVTSEPSTLTKGWAPITSWGDKEYYDTGQEIAITVFFTRPVRLEGDAYLVVYFEIAAEGPPVITYHPRWNDLPTMLLSGIGLGPLTPDEWRTYKEEQLKSSRQDDVPPVDDPTGDARPVAHPYPDCSDPTDSHPQDHTVYFLPGDLAEAKLRPSSSITFRHSVRNLGLDQNQRDWSSKGIVVCSAQLFLYSPALGIDKPIGKLYSPLIIRGLPGQRDEDSDEPFGLGQTFEFNKCEAEPGSTLYNQQEAFWTRGSGAAIASTTYDAMNSNYFDSSPNLESWTHEQQPVCGYPRPWFVVSNPSQFESHKVEALTDPTKDPSNPAGLSSFNFKGLLIGTPPSLTYERVITVLGWRTSMKLVYALMFIVVAWLGLTMIVQKFVTGSDQGSWKEMVPRMLVGFVAASVSYWWLRIMVDFADAVSRFIAISLAVTPADVIIIGPYLVQIIFARGLPFTKVIFTVLLFSYVLFFIMLVAQLIIRLILINLLIMLAPIAILLWSIPHTAGWGRKWFQMWMVTLFQHSVQLMCFSISMAFLKTNATISPTLLIGSSFLGTAFGTDGIWVMLLGVFALYLTTKIPSMLGQGAVFDAWLQSIYMGSMISRNFGGGGGGGGGAAGLAGALAGPGGAIAGTIGTRALGALGFGTGGGPLGVLAGGSRFGAATGGVQAAGRALGAMGNALSGLASSPGSKTGAGAGLARAAGGLGQGMSRMGGSVESGMGGFRAGANPTGSPEEADDGSSGARQNPWLSSPGEFGNNTGERETNAATIGEMSPTGQHLFHGASVGGKQKLLDLFNNEKGPEGSDITKGQQLDRANAIFDDAPRGAFTQREADNWVDRASDVHSMPTAQAGTKVGGSPAAPPPAAPQTSPPPGGGTQGGSNPPQNTSPGRPGT